MARIIYRGGGGGVGDPGTTLVDCPLCRQAVRLELHGDRLTGRCYGGCRADRVLERLGNLAKIITELEARS